jgi:two-component system response regulator RegA
MSTIKLLIIDDDDSFATLLARRMKHHGFETSIASTADDALTQLQQKEFDKAVLDLKLGNDSGLTLLPKLKASAPALEIVVLTGYSSIATAVEAIKLGARNYLCKPASSEDILHAFATESGNPTIDISSTPPSVERLEWEHIQKVLADNQGNISETARALGMHRRTLQRKLQKYPVRR